LVQKFEKKMPLFPRLLEKRVIVHFRDVAETLLMPCCPRVGLAGRSANCRIGTCACLSAICT
jgi:hypothetical protein